MQSFDQALGVIAGLMRDGVARHPDNDWVCRGPDYHVARDGALVAKNEEGEQLEDYLATRLTRLLPLPHSKNSIRATMNGSSQRHIAIFAAVRPSPHRPSS